MRSAKNKFVVDLIKLSEEMEKMDETGKMKGDFIERYGEIMSISNENCPKERPWIKLIKKLSKKLLKKDLTVVL
jgi:hypothetical protein